MQFKPLPLCAYLHPAQAWLQPTNHRTCALTTHPSPPPIAPRLCWRAPLTPRPCHAPLPASQQVRTLVVDLSSVHPDAAKLVDAAGGLSGPLLLAPGAAPPPQDCQALEKVKCGIMTQAVRNFYAPNGPADGSKPKMHRMPRGSGAKAKGALSAAERSADGGSGSSEASESEGAGSRSSFAGAASGVAQGYCSGGDGACSPPPTAALRSLLEGASKGHTDSMPPSPQPAQQPACAACCDEAAPPQGLTDIMGSADNMAHKLEAAGGVLSGQSCWFGARQPASCAGLAYAPPPPPPRLQVSAIVQVSTAPVRMRRPMCGARVPLLTHRSHTAPTLPPHRSHTSPTLIPHCSHIAVALHRCC